MSDQNFTTAEFDDLLEDTSWLDPIADFSLDFESELSAFEGSSMVDGSLSLTSERIEAQFETAGAPTLYTLSLSGSGIDPVSSLEDLEEAIITGTATGGLDNLTLDYGNQTIARFDFEADGYILTSGDQALKVMGALPSSLDDISALVSGLDDLAFDLETPGDDFDPDAFLDEFADLFSGYSLEGLSLRDGGEELLNIGSEDGDLVVSVMGYDFVFCDVSFNLGEILDAARPPELISPELALYEMIDGRPVEMSPEDNPFLNGFSFDDTAQLTYFVGEEQLGTYYLAVSAASDGPVTSGFYQLIEGGGAFPGQIDADADEYERVFEDPDNAPANPTTPYELPIGDRATTEAVGDFLGQIDPEGDVDWVRAELDEEGGYTFRVFGIPEDGVDDGFPAFFGANCIKVFNPSGDLIAEADLPGDLIPGLPDGPGDENGDGNGDDNGGAGTPEGFPDLPAGPAWGAGDPHLLTLDGVGYDFHAAGEYVMTRATDGSDFEVQARMSPVGENVTANVAAAIRLDGADVMVAPGDAPLRVNGEATDIDDGNFIEVGQDRIYRDGDSYMLIHTDDGDMETGYSAVQVDLFDARVDITVALDDIWQGNVEGLLGNFDGDPETDIALADGTVLDRPLAFDDLYGQYRDDWRVSDEGQSLFSYGTGESPESFYLPDYPTGMISIDDFSADQVEAAEARAEAAGLEPGTLAYQNAVLDLLLTDDDSYAESAVATDEVTRTRDDADMLEVPDTDGGGLEGLLTLSGSLRDFGGDAMESASVTFQPEGRSVHLTRLAREEGNFSFDLSEDAAGRLDATRDHDADSDPNITASDALDVLRLAVGLEPSFGPASPENFVAADINQDGQVTAGDALDVLRAAVGLESENAPRWVFFDADTDWNDLDLDRGNTAVETGVDIAAMQSDQSADMTCILLGSMKEYA